MSRLHLEHVGHRGVERLPPAGLRRVPGAHVHQLRGHPNPTRATRDLFPLDGGGEQVVYAQLAGDLLLSLRGPLVLVRAAPGDDGEAGDLGQLRAQIIGHAISEIGVSRVAEVLKGEHGQPLRTGGPGFGAGAQPGEQHA